MRAHRTLLVIALAVTGGAGCARSRASERDARDQAVKARVVSVEARQVRRNVETVGTLFPHDEVTVSAEVEGRVARVFVDVGDKVAAGRPLVAVQPVELGLAADQDQAALQQVRAQLGLEQGHDDLPSVDDAAEVKRAAADRTDAEQKYLRAKSLFDEGLISR